MTLDHRVGLDSRVVEHYVIVVCELVSVGLSKSLPLLDITNQKFKLRAR